MRVNPDGPLHCVKPVECEACLRPFAFDMYYYGGKIVCGDCRFYLRTGHVARHEIGCGNDVYVRDKDAPGGSSQTIGRFRCEQVVSARHAEILIDIERGRGD